MPDKENAEEPKPAAAKRVKKAVPEAPPEPVKETKLPTSPEIRAAKKAELVAWAEAFGLDAEGKVDELRKRVAEHVLKERKEAAEEGAPGQKEAEPKPAPKPEAKKAAAKPEKAEAKKAEEEAEEQEAAEYEAKAKPKLSPDIQRLLALRRAKSAARPAFRRQEWFRYKKFGDEWRKPQGGQSKLRRHFGYRWNLPSVGYRGPQGVRGLHPSGFQEILVHNVRQLDGLNPERQAVRVAHGVGARKREIIEKACDEKGLRVLNRMVTE